MRVIAGECKGRPLKAVPGKNTRPTTDKVKESIFNMIGPYFEGGLGIDLFSGSGGLAIEALSRGIDRMIVVDRDGKAIETIHENVKKCRYEERTEIYRNDAMRALKAAAKRDLRFDLVLLDPPYKKQQLIDIIEFMSEQKMVVENGVILCEHSTDVSLPNEIGHFIQQKHEVYGIIAVSIYFPKQSTEKQ